MAFEAPKEFFRKPEPGPNGYVTTPKDALDLTTSDYLLIAGEPVRITYVSKIGDVTYQLENGDAGGLSREDEIDVIERA